MTPVGHSLVGTAVGISYCYSQQLPVRSNIPVILAMILCANVPDFPLPGWGHSRYDISHSIFVGIALVLFYVLAARLIWSNRKGMRTWPIIFAGAIALFSHYLLDSFYNHGNGIAIFWPLSNARLTLPIPWFETMKINPLICWHNFRVWGLELLSYGLLLAATALFVNRRATPKAKHL